MPEDRPVTPRVHDLWRHRKGGVYLIIEIAERVEEEGGGPAIIYRSVETGKIWTQSQQRFLDNGRFVRCGKLYH